MKHLLALQILFLSCLGFLTACAPSATEQEHLVVNRAIVALGCADFESEFFNGIYDHLLSQKTRPRVSALTHFIDSEIQKKVPNWSHEKKKELSIVLNDLYENLLNLSLRQIGESAENKDSEQQRWLGFYTALEIGDQTSTRKKMLKQKLQADIGKIKELTEGESCALNSNSNSNANSNATSTSVEDLQLNQSQTAALAAGDSLAILGGRWAFATAYQSCKSAELPVMDKATVSVEGISVVGKHPDGIGNKRVISNLAKVLMTDYYLQNDNYDLKCIDVRRSPLIYDYGGKPFVESTDSNAALNFFKNAGDGTGVLGIDCSGFIFSALASSGLRLGVNKSLKAVSVYGVGSSMYLDPQNNGLSCFDKITMTSVKTIENGDIVAVNGHVVMLDDVVEDPFALGLANQIADCSKVSSEQFKFSILQSSPSKGGIGVNRYKAADYLKESGKLKAGLEKYAYYACLAKFQSKNIQPNLPDLSVIRHHGTKECMDKRVPLVGESCIQNCGFVTKSAPQSLNYSSQVSR